MAEPVRVRRLTDQEGQKLQQIVRRGSTSSVRYRRAMMLLASAGGNRVPVIAKLVQADEDTVRDVIHRFNEIGLTWLTRSTRSSGRSRVSILHRRVGGRRGSRPLPLLGCRPYLGTILPHRMSSCPRRRPGRPQGRWWTS
ncbi:helix-turn-helix domain-containing protein [Streptomyces sp. V3I7]|uniref:helix-turn-helix domain-containing protein n=1 Tax=Streptomyces sp. V3I7 TaxID=3042278 RepID=UPI0035939EDD